MDSLPVVLKALNLGTPVSRKEFRKGVSRLGKMMSKLPVHTTKRDFPVKNSWGDGLYIREFSCPSGNFFVTMIHKFDHPFFLLKGDVSILSEKGFERLQAPYYGITKAGTQRVMLTHSDLVWVTVHATSEKNVSKAFKQLTARTFREYERSKEK